MVNFTYMQCARCGMKYYLHNLNVDYGPIHIKNKNNKIFLEFHCDKCQVIYPLSYTHEK